MMIFCQAKKVAKEGFYGVKNHWDVNVDNIIISKLVEIKNNSEYLIGYLDEVIRPLVLILHKMSSNDQAFKVKDGDKNKNNKLRSFLIDDDKLLRKHKTM